MKKEITLFCVATLVLSVTQIYAQSNFYPTDSSKIAEVELSEISIKSIKENSNLDKLPASVSLISLTQLEQTETQNLKDITSQVPNLFMPDYGSKLTSPVYIRGIGSRINSPSIGLYVDGIPYFEKSVFDFDFFDVSHIEVLRGPQGTLYGRNTMGGIINITTKSPIKYQGTKVEASGGNYGYLKASVSHYHKISNKLGFALGAQANHNDGYFTNRYNNEQVDKLNSYSGMVKLRWAPSKHIWVEYVANAEKSRQGGYPYAVVDVSTMKASDINYDHYSLFNRDLVSNGLIFKFENDKVIVYSVTSHQYYSGHQDIDQDFTSKDLYAVVQDEKQNMLSEEIIARSNNNLKYNWLVGAYGFFQNFDKTLEMNYGFDYTSERSLPEDYSYSKFYNDKIGGAALFHQSTLSNLFVDGLTLTAGIRVDFENDVQDYLYQTLLSGVTKTVADTLYPERSFSKVVPKFTLDYALSDAVGGYISVAEGYKTGGYNSTFTNEDELTFDPESSWNYEVGVKSSLFDGKLNTNVSVFYIDWQNQQVYQPVATGQGSYLANAGKSKSKGVEIELHAKPLKNLEMDASYGYTNAKFVKYQKNSTTDLSGNYIPYVPKYTLYLSSNYTVAMNHVVESLSFNLNYRMVGKLYWNDENTYWQDGYGMLNGKISAKRGVFAVELWGKNLLNSQYNAFLFEALGSVYAQKGHPMAAGVNVIVNF